MKMLGALICVLTHNSRFILKTKIKEMLQVIEVLNVDKDKIEAISEYPIQIGNLPMRTKFHPRIILKEKRRTWINSTMMLCSHW